MADLASRITKPAAPAQPDVDASQVDGPGDVNNGTGLVDSSYDVEVKLSEVQGDTDHPLSNNVQSFAELGINAKIVDGLLAQNLKKPSKIQEKALPLILRDPPAHMIAQSQSGTGKTAAFVISVLSRINLEVLDKPQALVLAPSRELARQIEGVIRSIGQFCDGLQIQAAVPGTVERGASVNGNVVVGTPGTVLDLIRRRQFDVTQLRVLVIDEADNMLDQQGMGEQSIRVKSMIPKSVQILLFSATFPDRVMEFAQKYAPQANQLRLRQQQLTVKGISQMYMDCPSQKDKYDILCKLYGLMTIGSSVIFVRTRESANEIQRRMEADGHRVAALHGAYEGANRDTLLDEFREGKYKVLITTNVLARGIDVSSVSMVINYDIPMKGVGPTEEPDAETYLHRIGRTGRFGRVGVSITFVYDRKSFNALTSIAKAYSIDLIQLNADDWDYTEEAVQRIIKSVRAQSDYNPSAPQAAPQPT